MLITHSQDCLGCGACVALCPVEVLVLLKSGIWCGDEACTACGDCVLFCPVAALELAGGQQV